MAKKKNTESLTNDEKSYAVVIGCDLLNVREEPSTDAKVISTVSTGTRLEVTEYRSEWLYIVTEYGLEGWVMRKFTKVF